MTNVTGSGHPVRLFLQIHLTVSRRHASFRVTKSGRLLVEDHGSTNKTYLNEKPVVPHEPIEAKHGDTMSLSTKAVLTIHQEVTGC